LDQCEQWHANYWDCDCKSCDKDGNSGNGHDSCVLLKGLSEAKKMTLFSYPVMVYLDSCLLPLSLYSSHYIFCIIYIVGGY